MISIETLNSWGDAWATAMARSLVEASALLALVLVIWLPWRKRMSSQLGYGLFCLVLLRLAIPQTPAWPSWLPQVPAPPAIARLGLWPAGSIAAPDRPGARESLLLPATGDLAMNLTEAAAAVPAPAPAVEPAAGEKPGPAGRLAPAPAGALPRLGMRLPAYLMLAWAATALVLLVQFLRAVGATRRLIRDALPVDPAWMPVDVEALRRSLQVRANVRWAVSPRITTPAVGGLIRPTVLIPPDLEDELTPSQLTWVLLHELAHVRRADLWVVMAQQVIRALFFFHPAVHVANWAIDQLREYACDDTALAACQASRRDCGEGFLTVVERGVERPGAVAALGLFESRMLIRRRLVRILDPRRKIHAGLSPAASGGLVAAALAVLAVGRLPDAWAHTQVLGLGGTTRAPVSAVEPEPLTFGPGESWHREVAPGEPASPSARVTVLALAYTPDGSALATAAEDGVVVLRDLRSGRARVRFEGHRDAVSCLAFSPDGRVLASGSYDHTVRLWNVADGRPLGVLSGHSNWIFAVAISPDGQTLASAGHDRTVRLWDVARVRPAGILSGHSGSVRALAFAPDGRSLASGGADRSVTLWDLSQHTPRARLQGHRGTVRALAFAPGGASARPALALASAGEDGELRLWDATPGREHGTATLAGHTDMVVCLAFSPGGTTLASGGLDATVKLWDPRTGRERATLRGHEDGVSAVAFAPEARQLATAGFDGAVRLWEPSVPVFSPASCLAASCAMTGLGFTADGRGLLAVGKSGIVRWDVRTGSRSTPGPVDPARSGEPAGALAVSPDGASYAEGTATGAVRLHDARKVAELLGHSGAIASLAYAPDGRTLASGGRDGLVTLWSPGTRTARRVLAGATGAVGCVRFAGDGRVVAVAAERGVTLWDAATGTPLAALGGADHRASALAVAPDGGTVATAGGDGLIRLWDVATGVQRLAWNEPGCRALAFAPDGKMLASAARRGVALWDTGRGRPLALLRGHGGEVEEIAFAPDGRGLATAGSQGAVMLWNLGVGRRTAWATLRGEGNCPWGVAYTPDGRTLAVADAPSNAPGSITLWDVPARRVRSVLDGPGRGIIALAVSADGRLVASGGFDRRVRIDNLETGESRPLIVGLDGVVTGLAFSPDGTLLATAGESGSVGLWDPETGEETARLEGFRGRVRAVAFSPDGTRVAAAGGVFENGPNARGEVRIWDVATRKPLAGFDGAELPVLAVAFAPDGSALAAGGLDQTLRIWNVADGRRRLAVAGLPGYVQALGFSPNGRTVAWSGQNSGMVALVDAATGSEVTRLVGHTGAVVGLAFAPDGSGLATTSADRTIKLWDLPPPGAAVRPDRD